MKTSAAPSERHFLTQAVPFGRGVSSVTRAQLLSENQPVHVSVVGACGRGLSETTRVTASPIKDVHVISGSFQKVSDRCRRLDGPARWRIVIHLTPVAAR